MDSLEWFNRINDIPNAQFGRSFIQHEATVQASARVDKLGSHQSLHQLGQVGPRDLRDLRNLLRSAGGSLILGQRDDGPQRVFDGL